MRLIDDLWGMTAGWEPCSEADFAGVVQSSNASLIPAELVIDLALAQVEQSRDRDVLIAQSERQIALLAGDRRVISLVCAHADLSPAAVDWRLDSLDAVRACFAELLVRDVAVLLTVDLAAPLPAADMLARAACRELVLQVPADFEPARLGAWLAALRAGLAAQPHPPVVSVWLRRAAARGASALAHCAALLATATQHTDAIHLLPLLLPAGPPATMTTPWPAADYALLERQLIELGWTRSAPCLYCAPHAIDGCYLATLLRMHHQVDVLGIGATATSRFPPFCFRNLATLAAVAADLRHGGFGIAAAYAQTPVWQLLSELVASLAAGTAVKPDVVAAKYRQVSEPFRDMLEGTFAALAESGALCTAADGSARVALDNDRAFGTAVTRLYALGLVTPSATVRLLRPPLADPR